ncbi:unnamed protein product [Nezara viridula]|uniref:Uncharacterized protein n=1 Tax=Nezara viridula TaxID=85310 RepID=A0A9P0H3P1_NEZVI|nr:unnamed protein product [Nezara viridula]
MVFYTFDAGLFELCKNVNFHPHPYRETSFTAQMSPMCQYRSWPTSLSKGHKTPTGLSYLKHLLQYITSCAMETRGLHNTSLRVTAHFNLVISWTRAEFKVI